MIIKENLQEFQDFIQEPGKKIAIISHPRPDADALGSALAMREYVQHFGHHADAIMPTDYPGFLSWMKGAHSVYDYADESKKATIRDLILDADLIICLDFSKLKRIGELGSIVEEAKGKKLLIDHHLDPDQFADYVMWSADAAATCELIFQMWKELGDEEVVTVPMAECIYAGIMTDTGSFRHPTTTGAIHRIVADLMDIGINNSKIHQYIFDNQSEHRLRFLGYMLSEKLHVLSEYRTAYMAVTAEELERFKTVEGDTEGVVNYALSIQGIAFAIFAIDRGDFVKFSFRSVGDFAVNELAQKHFNGGGHKNAAGGSLDAVTADEAIEVVLKVLPEYKEELMALEVLSS